MIDYRKICYQAADIIRETGDFIIKELSKFDKSRTEVKGLNDFVSYVDRGSEAILVEKLESQLPEAGFLAEEGTSSKKGLRYCWVIDPLDGTTNYLHGLHPFAISVALMKDNEIVIGIVYEAGGNEMFISWKNGGTWLNHTPVHVSDTKTLDNSLIATGFPYYDFSRLDNFMILVREAGGRVSDFTGNENNFSGNEIIASNSLVYSEFLENVSKFMHS